MLGGCEARRLSEGHSHLMLLKSRAGPFWSWCLSPFPGGQSIGHSSLPAGQVLLPGSPALPVCAGGCQAASPGGARVRGLRARLLTGLWSRVPSCRRRSHQASVLRAEAVGRHAAEAGAATVEGPPPPSAPARPPARPACPGAQEGGAQPGLQAPSLLRPLCELPGPKAAE